MKVSLKNNIILVTFDSLIGKLNEFITKIVFKQKADPTLANNIEIRNENDNYFVSVFDLNDGKLLTNIYNKLSNLMELYVQIKKIHPNVKLVYDSEPSIKKLFLIIYFQDFYANQNHAVTKAISNSKKLKVVEVNDIIAKEEEFYKALQSNNSIKKIVFKIFDERKIQKILEYLKLNSSIETMCIKDIKLSGEGILETFNSFFSSNSSLVSLNLMKNKLDQNGNGLEALKDLLINSKVPLKKLNISNNTLKSENFSKNLGEILKNKKLTKLKFGRCQLNTLESFNSLYNYVNPSNLQILDLSFNYIDLDLISDFIVNNNNISKLILQKIRIPKTSDLKRFGNVFISSLSLKTLGFYYDIIDEDKVVADPNRLIEFYNGFACPAGCEKSYKSYKMELVPDIMSQFANIVGANDCLTEVNFSLCVFKQKSFGIFLSAFAKSTNFKSLILDSLEIESDDLKVFAQFVNSSKSMIKFDVSNTKMSTEDLNLIGDAIVANPKIKSISLSNCLKEDTDAKEFLIKISKSTLEEIDFTFCDGKESYSEAFGKLLNNCPTLRTVKVGRKQEDFDSKVNNNLFAITNKLNIEKISISNIKFDGNAMKDFIMNNDKLRSLTLNNSTNNSNFIKYFVQKNQQLDFLSFSLEKIDEEDVSHLSKLLYLVKHLFTKSKNLTNSQAEIIFDGLNGNKQIEHFELLFDNFEDNEFIKSIKKYYNNALTCDSLSNLMIFNIAEDSEEIRLNYESKENSKNIFLDFLKNLNA